MPPRHAARLRPMATDLFPPSVHPARGAGAAAQGHGLLAVTLAGEALELHADRALYWPRARTLFVADVHLGKGASLRAGGVPLPRGATASDLARLSALVARTGAAELVVLGDLLHAAAGRVAALDAAFGAWRAAQPDLRVTLVRGNHDTRAGDPPPAWGVRVVAEHHPLPPFLACHVPAEPRTGYALCGHVHPGVRLTGAGRQTERLPCFVLGRRCALLPAFGRLTGLAMVAPAPDATIVAVAGTQLYPLPPGT